MSVDTDGIGAKEYCEKWMEILVERIEKYQDHTDIYSLALSYAEYGLALLHNGEEEEALKSTERSCQALEEITPPGKLITSCFPWKHRGRILVYSGRHDQAEAVVAPFLAARERVLGKDDTVSYE